MVLCLIAPITIDAQKEPLGNGLYWELNNDVLTISGNGAMPDYSSPWKDKGTIRKIVIEYGVTAIGNASFWKPHSPYTLQSVVIAHSVKAIGPSAFWGCTGLTSITIPNSVTSIGRFAFHDCTGFTSICIPNSVTTIEQGAFQNCTGLTNTQIENLTDIPTSLSGGG